MLFVRSTGQNTVSEHNTPDTIFTSTLSSTNNPSRPSSTVPRVEIEPPTPSLNPNMPFRDYPDGRPSSNSFTPHSYNEDEEDERDDREIMDSQEMVMQGKSQICRIILSAH